jgi:hypothetical protein
VAERDREIFARSVSGDSGDFGGLGSIKDMEKQIGILAGKAGGLESADTAPEGAGAAHSSPIYRRDDNWLWHMRSTKGLPGAFIV